MVTKAEVAQKVWDQADLTRFEIVKVEFDGSSSFVGDGPQKEEIKDDVRKAERILKAKPTVYVQALYQSDMETWPKEQQRFELLRRTGSELKVKNKSGGGFMLLTCRYKALPPLDVPKDYAFLDNYEGIELTHPRLCPGRGHGVWDKPGLKIIQHARPTDVSQGSVGDCWLLCGFAALAEYPGAIAKLFQKSGDFRRMPRDSLNTYTVTLYDLSTWKEVDVEVNESLCTAQDGSSLLGARPSDEGELWVCILEKAVAVHCGGWDKIKGGQTSHAWRLLTGSKEQYTIERKRNYWQAYSMRNPNENNTLPPMKNSPSENVGTVWGCNWPGTVSSDPCDAKKLFEHMCNWEKNGFLIAAGTRPGSDKEDHEGIVDGHAYTVLNCFSLEAHDGSEINLVRVRNPWGRGEFTSGQWDDDGPGWVKYPEIKEACNPVLKEDGIFWLSRNEFLKYFPTIYVCAEDMREWGKPYDKELPQAAPSNPVTTRSIPEDGIEEIPDQLEATKMLKENAKAHGRVRVPPEAAPSYHDLAQVPTDEDVKNLHERATYVFEAMGRLTDRTPTKNMNYWGRQEYEHRDRSHISGAGSCGPAKVHVDHRWDLPKSVYPGAGPSCLGAYAKQQVRPRERHMQGEAGRLPRNVDIDRLGDRSRAISPQSGPCVSPRGGAGSPWSPVSSPSAISPSTAGAPPSSRMSPDVALSPRFAAAHRSANYPGSPSSGGFGIPPATGFNTTGFGAGGGYNYNDRYRPSAWRGGSGGRGAAGQR